MAFWGLDFLKGSPVRQHIKDLEQAFAVPAKGRELARERLEKFLEHACTTTPFYKRFAGTKKLDDFPVIQKRMIKYNYGDFLSSAYDKKDLVTVTTSGSYGTPFKFYLTKDKRARQQAEIVFFNRWVGYRVGMRYCQVRVHPRGRLLLFMQNGFLIDPSVIDNEWLEQHRQILKTESARFIIIYPSALLPLAEYCREKGDRPEEFHVRVMINTSEPLLESVRKAIEGVFGCSIVDRYCANELGVISHECMEYKRHHINFSSHHVELLKLDSDEPVEQGETGRVVITDFFSYAMPLIRYDTGDVANWGPRCLCGLDVPVFEKVGGRLTETIYDPSGRMVNALGIDRDPKDLDGIIQFQFIQKTRDSYLVKLHVTDSFDQEDTLRKRFLARLGLDAQIRFEYVDSIPALPSGKRPYIINEFLKSQNSMS
jgi:phenylacetate-CoA ligase